MTLFMTLSLCHSPELPPSLRLPAPIGLVISSILGNFMFQDNVCLLWPFWKKIHFFLTVIKITYSITFTTLTVFQCVVRCAYVAVQPSPPSIHWTLSICVASTRSSSFRLPAGHRPTFCLYEFHHVKPLLRMRPYGICLFCGWFISLSKMSSSFIHIVARVRTSFLFKAEYYCPVCIHPILLLYSSLGGHLGWSHLLNVAN